MYLVLLGNLAINLTRNNKLYGDFYRLLITFSNNLDPECWAWSGSKLLDTLLEFLKEL